VTAAALLGFIALMTLRPWEFLDRDFYLTVSGLMGVLFVDQLFAMRRDRAAREAAQRRSAQLELALLRRSVAPHFMMNTLNSLAEWVESNPAKGVRMIEALGNQMRALAALGERDAIPLPEEIELVRNYLAVMSFRADAPFSLVVNGETRAIKTPPGILHTLAENGFSHNRYPKGGEFRLDIEASGDRMRLVFETPPSTERRARVEGGEGRAYVHGRLAAAYREGAHFTDGPAGEGRWRSVIDMPAAAL
jgi:LytS/YehU family sensor histidine kinase